jgi:hydrocephalus-inducing protein
MEIAQEITFHPSELNQDIRYENIPCEIEGMSPLYLTLTGMCIPQPVQTDLLKFSAPVRSPDVKNITLLNKSTSVWHIQPIIDNEYWTGPQSIDVEIGQIKSYDLTFYPLDTNGSGEGGRHEGSIFFPLPDGTGILYRMVGNADKPMVVETISREIQCKTLLTEYLPVSNWLRRSQRFKVITEFVKAESGVVFKGHDFIDVPPLLSKDYKFTYYAYKDGMIAFKVIFKNETTQEYLYFSLNYKGTPAGVTSTIEMTSAVRQLLAREVTIYNPLSTAVTFNGSSNNLEVSVPHTTIIQPKSEGICSFEFLPLQPKESSARITLASSDLGAYQYDLKLNAVPCGPERPLTFKIGLGGSQTQTFRFMSYPKTRTDYNCKIENPEFSVEKTVFAAGGTT